MKISLLPTMTVLFVALSMFGWESAPRRNADGRTPVLVELFTSEGCSSCPPADELLRMFDQQPIAGEDLIVLSEHVDYWNHIGWKDPYSAHYYSARQSAYGARFGLDSVYTPQMVVDGSVEFVGSDKVLAKKALARAQENPKIAVNLSPVSIRGGNVLETQLQVAALAASFGLSEAEVYVAVALDHAESTVSHGENAGRRLAHTAVVRSIVKVGGFRRGQTFAQDVHLKIEPAAGDLRLIAFVQEPGQGRVIGAAMQQVEAKVAPAQ